MLRRRRMVRSFDPDRPVPPAAVDSVVRAATRAPSAGFTQAVELLVLSAAEDRAAYWAVTADRDTSWLRRMRTAPVLISVWTSREAYLDRYAQPDKGWVDRDPGRWPAPFWFVDAGMASMAALLAAVDAELGACFFGVPTDRVTAVREQFGVPADRLSVGVISLGYPDPAEQPSGSATRRPRRPAEEVIHRDHW